MISLFNDDITFCASPCNDTECMRHPSNIQDKTFPHSFAKFDGTEFCHLTVKNRETEFQKEEFLQWYFENINVEYNNRRLVSTLIENIIDYAVDNFDGEEDICGFIHSMLGDDIFYNEIVKFYHAKGTRNE